MYKQNFIFQVDPRKTIEVGSYQIRADGKPKPAVVKYAGSEVMSIFLNHI